MEERSLFRCIEAYRVLARTRRPEVVGVTADGDHQRVVRDHAPRDQLDAIIVERGGDQHHAPLAVEAVHASQLEAEVMPARLREVIQIVLVEVHAAGGDLVQQRFPQMSARTVDERDLRAALASELVAQTRRELEATGAATDDYDLMHVFGTGLH